MKRNLLEILSSGLFVFLIIQLLDAYGQIIWALIENWTGELITGVILCALFGAIFSLGSGVKLSNFTVGVSASFLIWAVHHEITTSAFYQIHYESSILVLSGFVVGAGVVETAERLGLLQRSAVFQ